MRRGGAWLPALIMFGVAARASAQHAVQIEAPVSAEPAQLVRTAIAGPHDIMLTDSTRRLVLPRGTTLPRTTVVIGGPASVGAGVRGDIIVVGGDLFLQPGAVIDGRAIAIGGAVYGSTLAAVAGGTQSFRDRTFDVSTIPDGIRLTYRNSGGRDPGFELPLLDGLRIPSYDRVNGASIPWGPILRPTARLELEPMVTYRSHMGAWDPAVRAVAQAGETWRLTLDARRGTFTNDAWIQSDLINSFNTLIVGTDTRNYYRADRGELSATRVDRTVAVDVETSFGVVTERAWSVGSPDTTGARPWSLRGRGDADNLARPNPRVRRGRISSAFVGSAVQWQFGDVRISGNGRIEVPWQAPGDVRFVQITTDGSVRFPTFGLQRFRADVHLVATPGDTAPPQRFAYVGGTGTLPVVPDPLSFGGDQLLLVDMRYEIPVQRIRLPFAGSPLLTLRHRAGAAGVQRLPRLVQNAGVMVTVSFIRLEYAMDPATRKQNVGVSLSFAR